MMKNIPDESGHSDLAATMRGIGCAYVAFAYGLRAEDETKDLLVDLADGRPHIGACHLFSDL